MDVSREMSTNCILSEGTADLEKKTFIEQKKLNSQLIHEVYEKNVPFISSEVEFDFKNTHTHTHTHFTYTLIQQK